MPNPKEQLAHLQDDEPFYQPQAVAEDAQRDAAMEMEWQAGLASHRAAVIREAEEAARRDAAMKMEWQAGLASHRTAVIREAEEAARRDAAMKMEWQAGLASHRAAVIREAEEAARRDAAMEMEWQAGLASHRTAVIREAAQRRAIARIDREDDNDSPQAGSARPPVPPLDDNAHLYQQAEGARPPVPPLDDNAHLYQQAEGARPPVHLLEEDIVRLPNELQMNQPEAGPNLNPGMVGLVVCLLHHGSGGES